MIPVDVLAWGRDQTLQLTGSNPPRSSESDPPIHYMPCPDHEAAIEVEGYCPCFDGLEIDWDKTDIWRNE